jgi:hypothetical protein
MLQPCPLVPAVLTYTGTSSGVWNFATQGAVLSLPPGTYTFTVNRATTLRIMGAAGGGGGASANVGAGGGGGASHTTGLSIVFVTAKTYTVVVGAGGSVGGDGSRDDGDEYDGHDHAPESRRGHERQRVARRPVRAARSWSAPAASLAQAVAAAAPLAARDPRA